MIYPTVLTEREVNFLKDYRKLCEIYQMELFSDRDVDALSLATLSDKLLVEDCFSLKWARRIDGDSKGIRVEPGRDIAIFGLTAVDVKTGKDKKI